MLCVAILYDDDAHMPLSIAKIHDEDLLSAAAQAAIHEAEQKADVLARSDAVLGRLQMEEAAKLRRVLGFLVTPTCAAVV